MRLSKLILLLLLIPCVVFARGDYYKGATATAESPSITYDASSSGTEGWGTTVAWNHTLTTEDNSAVVVVVSSHDGEHDITGCNWDNAGTPVAMTALTTYGEPCSYTKGFYILDPAATGAKEIQCTAAGNTTLIGTAISIYGATETGSSTTNHDGSTNTSQTSISDTLTTGTDGSWVVVGGSHCDSEEALSTTQGETKRIQQNTAASGGNATAISTEEIPTAGANTFGWSGSVSDNWVIIMMEFEPI